MATNLVSAVRQSLSSEVTGKLASSLGLEQAAAQKGINAAIPGILAEFAETASEYDGVHKLSRAISQVDKLAGGGGDLSLLDSGKSVLGSGWNIGSSVIGGGALETLSSAVARYAGFDLGSAKKLISFLVPVVLVSLKREQASHNLTNFGLAKLLTGQKGDIRRAIPAGFTPQSEPRPPVPQAAPATTSTYGSASASSVRQDRAKLLIPALLLVAAAVWFLQKREETRTAQPANQSITAPTEQAPAKEAAQTATPAAPDTAPVAAATIEKDVEANIERLRVALPKVSDPASAQAAVSEIRNISARFAQLKSAAQQLSAEARKSVSEALSSKVSELNKLLERVIKEINFLSGEAKPAIDTLKGELANLSKA